jgi:hypothetical protein
MRAVLDEWLSILLIEDDARYAEIRQKGDDVTILYPEEALRHAVRFFPPTETEIVLIGDFNGGRGIGVDRGKKLERRTCNKVVAFIRNSISPPLLYRMP